MLSLSRSFHHINDHTDSIPSSSLNQSATKPISLLFTSSAAITPLYKALSTDFHKTLDFYAARESKVGAEAMLAFGVSKTPALVILRGETVEVYEGE